MWTWAALIGLGVFHGLNPAMGWLFAVALGLQERSRVAVVRALAPIGLGHGASIAVVVAVLAVARLAVELRALQLAAAAVLVAFGAYRLMRGYRHKFRVGMRAGYRDLALWSFLMATSHGAGLMVVPVLLQPSEGGAAALGSHHSIAAGPAIGDSLGFGLAAAVVHTAAMLLVTGVIAVAVFQWAGLAFLRRGWVNLELLWSLSLIATGMIMVVLLIGAH